MNSTNRKRNDWTAKEDTFLVANLMTLSNREIATHLGRTLKSVEARVYNLNLNRKTLSHSRKGEKWVKVGGFPNYEVSNFGAVRNRLTGIEIKPFLDGSKYMCVKLHSDGTRKSFKVHRLVALSFSPIENADQLTVNHIDLDKSNNRIENLEWLTSEENVKHAWKSGVCKEGETHYGSIYTEDLVRRVCELIVSGKSNKEITVSLGIKDAHFVSSVRCRKKWKQISSEYQW